MAVRQAMCVHHWLLSVAGMATVRAVCRRCGAHRRFPAILDFRQEVFPEFDQLGRNRPPLAIDAVSMKEHARAR